MSEQRFPLGGVDPGPPSPHDWLIQELIGEPPERLPLASSVPNIGPVFDQSNPAVQGTCVADAFVTDKNHHEYVQLHRYNYDDQSMGRGNASSVNRFYLAGTGDKTYQQGWYVKGAMDCGLKVGVTATDGHRYLIGSYYSLLAGDLGANIRNTIATLQRPVQIAFPWYWSYWESMDAENSWPHGIMPPPVVRDGVAGGHSQLVWRYTWYAPMGQYLYCLRQSWGLPFGVNGNQYVTEAFLRTVYEALVAVDR